jgi:hypothetical protein
VCYPAGATLKVGNPISVQVRSQYSFVPILGIGTITLQGKATMLLEDTPKKLTGAVTPCP